MPPIPKDPSSSSSYTSPPPMTMATSRDTPNPLRPYYIPPSIGLPRDPPANNSTSAATASPPKHSTLASSSSRASSIPKPSFGSQARDYLSDLDYGEYLGEANPSMAEMAKKLMDQALWNYTCVLLAQPFEVAKTVLQCHLAPSHDPSATAPYGTPSRPSSYASGKFEDYGRRRWKGNKAKLQEQYPSEDEDSDADSPSYFTSTAPKSPTPASPSRSPERVRRPHSRSGASTPTPSNKATYKLELRRSDSLFEVIGQLWQKESAWGLWKGTNATFVYNFLLKTIESWSRSLLSALLNIPDPSLPSGSGIGGLDIVDSQNPLASLAVAVAAASIAGVILAPLDLIRTRLILTHSSSPPRNILPSLRALPSLSIPSEILPVTLLHSSLPTLFSSSAPLVLRSTFGIDPILTPATYSLSTFLSSTAELFLRLPLETVLRRGQVAVLQEQEREKEREAFGTFRSQKRKDGPEGLKTVVDVGPYKGTFGTMWFIIREEGVSFVGPAGAAVMHGQRPRPGQGRVKKGQGIHGLWRGWRVGFWGIVGVWGAAALGGNAGGEF